MVLVRILRSSSAWALPRPSAMASAKLANRQVNQSQRQIWRLKPDEFARDEQKDGGPDRADIDDEHDQVLDLVARIQFLERINDRLPDQRGVLDFSFGAHKFSGREF